MYKCSGFNDFNRAASHSSHFAVNFPFPLLRVPPLRMAEQYRISIFWLTCFGLFLAPRLWAVPHIPPGFLSYTVNDGLPSNELYALCQDKEKFLWIASDRGVCRYDGKTFQTYTVADGLADNSIINLFLDEQGRLWMLGVSKRLSWLENGRLHTFPGNPELEKQFINSHIFSIHSDENDTLWIGSAQGHFKSHIRDTTLTRIESGAFPQAAYNLKLTPGGLICYHDTKNKGGPITFQGKLLSGENVSQDPLSRPILSSKNKVWMNTRSKVVEISLKTKNVRVHDLSPWTPRVSSIHEDQDHNLWVCFLHNGVLKLPGKNPHPQNGLHLFKGISITSSFADHDGGIWLTTIGKGLFHIPNGACKTLRPGQELSSQTPYKFAGDEKGNYWVADHEKGADVCSPTSLPTPQFSRNASKWGQVKDFENLSGLGFLVSLGRHNNFLFQNSQQPQQLKAKSGKYFNGLENDYWNLTPKALIQFRKTDHAMLAHYPRQKVGILDLVPIDNAHLLLGTYKGLMLFSARDTSLTPIAAQHPLLNERVEKICRVGDTYLLATRGAGLVFFQIGDDPMDFKAWNLGLEAGLASNLSNHVTTEGDSLAWVSTHKGLNRLQFSAAWQLQDIRTYDYRDGLASNQILHTFVHKGRVWTGTPAGVSTFMKGSLILPQNVPLYIREVKADDIPQTRQQLRKLQASQNRIQINFQSVCFRRKPEYGYEYRLSEDGAAWSYTQNEAIALPKLSPGDYTLELRVVQAPASPISATQQVAFTILKPWWQNGWLYLIVLIAGSSLLVGIGYRFQQRQQRRLYLEKTIIDLQAKALSAQMNPHFAFNALGTVQHYIQNGDMTGALLQLGRFSDLLRLVLRHSHSKWIPLEQEIKMLRLYLELEADRFEGLFSYEIIVSSQFEPTFDRVPPMILQPFVENAIWHGLLPKEGEKKLQITFQAGQDHATCMIEDNGVGLHYHSDKPQTNHFSMGISVTRKRLAILQPGLAPEETVVIQDLKETGKNATGTLVTLILPLK